jgi:hypothetical protein
LSKVANISSNINITQIVFMFLQDRWFANIFTRKMSEILNSLTFTHAEISSYTVLHFTGYWCSTTEDNRYITTTLWWTEMGGRLQSKRLVVLLFYANQWNTGFLSLKSISQNAYYCNLSDIALPNMYIKPETILVLKSNQFSVFKQIPEVMILRH